MVRSITRGVELYYHPPWKDRSYSHLILGGEGAPPPPPPNRPPSSSWKPLGSNGDLGSSPPLGVVEDNNIVVIIMISINSFSHACTCIHGAGVRVQCGHKTQVSNVDAAIIIFGCTKFGCRSTSSVPSTGCGTPVAIHS